MTTVSSPPRARPASRSADPERPTRAVGHDLTAWKQIAARTLRRAKQDRISMTAGSIAYHAFLALVPIVIALIGVASLLNLGTSQIETLVNGIGKALPHGAATVLQSAVRSAEHRTGGSVGVVVVAVLISIWSASGAMTTIETGLDAALRIEQSRKFVASRIRGLVLLGIVVVFGGSAAALVVFAKPLGQAIESHLPLSGTAFVVVWTVVRWVAALLLAVTVFSLLLRYGPNRPPPPRRWVSVGSLVATAVWLISSLVFSFYDAASGSYAKTYGALAGVVVLLFWLYLTSLAILLGGQLDAELDRGRAPEPPRDTEDGQSVSGETRGPVAGPGG